MLIAMIFCYRFRKSPDIPRLTKPRSTSRSLSAFQSSVSSKIAAPYLRLCWFVFARPSNNRPESSPLGRRLVDVSARATSLRSTNIRSPSSGLKVSSMKYHFPVSTPPQDVFQFTRPRWASTCRRPLRWYNCTPLGAPVLT